MRYRYMKIVHSGFFKNEMHILIAFGLNIQTTFSYFGHHRNGSFNFE